MVSCSGVIIYTLVNDPVPNPLEVKIFQSEDMGNFYLFILLNFLIMGLNGEGNKIF